MAAPKRPTHEVVHPNLNLMVEGHLRRMAVGTPLILSKAQAESFGDKVRDMRKKQPVDVSNDDGGDGE